MQKIARAYVEIPTNPLVSIIANGQTIALSNTASPIQNSSCPGDPMRNMQKVLGVVLLVAAASTYAMATVGTPEIPVGSAGSAIALVSGMLLMFRGRRK
jgi:hypothetical protein